MYGVKRLFLLALVLTVLWVAGRLALPWQVESKLRAIRHAGYPVTLAELDRWYPEVSREANGAELYGAAFAKLGGGVGRVPLALDGLTDGSSQRTPLPSEVKRSLDVLLAGNGGVLDSLHQAAALKQSRYPLDLSRLSMRPYSHLGYLRWSAHLLEGEALHYADDQDSALAARSVTSLLGLARSLAAEPIVRSHLARIDCQQIAAASLEQVLNRTVPADADLGHLTTALNEADDPQSLTRAFVGQRCIGIYSFDMMMPSANPSMWPVKRSLPLWQQMVIYPVLFIRFPSLLYYPSGLMHWDELRYLQFMNRYIAAAEAGFPERIAAAQSSQRAVARLPWFHVLARLWLRNMNGSAIILKDAANTARLRAARTAIAVERYRLAHGQLPTTLTALVPSYLDAVPADPFDPASAGLQYRKLAKGYVVYSIGSDATNDNGDKKKGITFMVER
jgi:hypothetical protein